MRQVRPALIGVIVTTIICVIHGKAEQTRKRCEDLTIHTNVGTFQWRLDHKPVTAYAASTLDNLCWHPSDGDAAKLVIQKCDATTGKWLPSDVRCAPPSAGGNNYCPEELIEIHIRDKEYICVHIAEQRHTYDEQRCLGADKVPFSPPYLTDKKLFLTDPEMHQLGTHLRRRSIEEYWLPVAKVDGNPHQPFVVRQPGESWGQYFAPNSMSAVEVRTDTNCMTAFYDRHNRTWSSHFVRCDQPQYSVCVFSKHLVTVSGCPQDFGALSYRPHKCYGIESIAGLFPYDLHNISLAEYYHDRNMLRLILRSGGRTSKLFFRVDEFDGFAGDPQRYAIEMNADEQLRIAPLKVNEPSAALSWELLRNRKSVQMALKMDSDDLVLTVYNRYYIWRLGSDENHGISCFTNAGYELVRPVKIEMMWQNDLKTKTMFRLRLVKQSVGHYWCEAHTIFNFGRVATERVVARHRAQGHRYAVRLNVTCEMLLCNLQNLKFLSREIRQKLKDNRDVNSAEFHELQVHDVYIMKITGIWGNATTTLECVCHVAASLRNSSVDNSSAASSEQEDSEENEDGVRHDSEVRMVLRDKLQRLIASAYPADKEPRVLSTEFCFPEPMSGSLGNMWKQADIGQSETTLKLCLTGAGLPITRKCRGDFIDGAHWEPLDNGSAVHSCTAQTGSDKITTSLYTLQETKLYRKSPAKAVKDVKQLLETHINNLIPADLYYMAKIIQSSVKRLTAPPPPPSLLTATANNTPLAQLSYSDETSGNIMRIYNYLMEVNESVIKPSIVLNSTNILLDTFERLIDEIAIARHNAAWPRNATAAAAATPNPQRATTQRGPPSKSYSLIDDTVRNIDSVEYDDIGALVKLTTNLALFVLDPKIANVSGIALLNSNYDDDDASANFDTDSDYYEMGQMHGAFKGKYYRFIMSNQSVADLLYEPGIEIATFVPQSLLNRLDEISTAGNSSRAASPLPEPRIVIKIYANDRLFQEEEEEEDESDDNVPVERAVWGKIISISIPGHDRHLPESLPLMLRVKIDDDDLANYGDTSQEDDNQTSAHSCSYWNYRSWANDGVSYIRRSPVDPAVILCGCSHLTPFAYIIGGDTFALDYEEQTRNDSAGVAMMPHRRALDIITVLGCSLSLFGVLGIFVTAFTFQSWRQKASSKVLLQLSAAIAFQMILFCFVNTEEATSNLLQNQIISSCILLGASLHYSVLVQFSWMLIIAYLQFKRYVQVFNNNRPKRFFIKSTALGWLVPLVPVVLLVAFDYDSYIPAESVSHMALCYPTGRGLYLGVVLPVTLVIVANFIIFVMVLYNILRGPDGSIRHTEKRLALSQIRLSVLLFFLLGFTWIFGLLTTARAGIVFSYLFSLTATLQGFVIFIYFIVLDPVTRRLWSLYFRRKVGSTSNYESSATSIKETTQTQ